MRQGDGVDDEEEEDKEINGGVCYLERGVGGLLVEGSVEMSSTRIYVPPKPPKV